MCKDNKWLSLWKFTLKNEQEKQDNRIHSHWSVDIGNDISPKD